MFSLVRYKCSSYLINSRDSVGIHEMGVVLCWTSCPVAISVFLPMTSSLLHETRGCKSFELLWETHAFNVTTRVLEVVGLTLGQNPSCDESFFTEYLLCT